MCTAVYGAPCSQINYSKVKTMQIKTNFYWKIEGRKEAVYRLETVCTCNVLGLWTLNIFADDLYLSWGTLTKHDREPMFGHGNTFDRGRRPVGPCMWNCNLSLTWLSACIAGNTNCTPKLFPYILPLPQVWNRTPHPMPVLLKGGRIIYLMPPPPSSTYSKRGPRMLSLRLQEKCSAAF